MECVVITLQIIDHGLLHNSQIQDSHHHISLLHNSHLHVIQLHNSYHHISLFHYIQLYKNQ